MKPFRVPTLTTTGPHAAQPAVVNDILRSLPAWFGIEESIVNYVKEASDLAAFHATDDAGRIAGFLTIKHHFPAAAEIHLIAVRPEHHGSGVGSALVARAEHWLATQKVEYLQVKTLGPSRPNDHYARTRRFYESVGFRPLEEFKTLWNERNPCLVMVKRIAP